MLTAANRKTEYAGHELERLLSGVAAGEHEALDALYRRTRTAVYAMALSYLKNAHDAQDLTQDVFVRVWERAEQYRGGSPMAWILAVCRSLCLMHLRREDRHTSPDPALWDALPDEAALSPQERAILSDALARLDEQERRIVLLHAAAGLKHREIASLEQLPLPTVLSKYHRALKKMRADLEGDDAR